MLNGFTKKNGRFDQELESAYKRTEHSVIGFFVRKFRFTYMILAVIILFGFFAIFTLPKEAEPEVKVPFATVTTVYPGANPTDIEELITDKIEEKIKNLDNLKTFNSSSAVGFSSIFVEFEAEADIPDSMDKLKDAVDQAKPELPDEADDPFVQEINFNDIPIVTYSFVGDYTDEELKHFADTLQNELENVKDVSRVPILGGIEREFQIITDQTQLVQYGISMGQVISAIRLSNFNLPAGEIEIDGYNYSVRTQGKFQNAQDLSGVVIIYYNNAPVYLRDVAQIVDTYKEKNTESRIGIGDQDPKNTISLQVFKKTGGNILDIVENCQQAIDGLYEREVLPDSLQILKTNDNSIYIKDDINRLGKSGLQTMILIIILLFAVLGIRGAIITGISVPIAFLMAFIVLMIQGMTINSMVLFSLVLSLGLMVDNSIIVMEGINEYMYKHDKTPYQAALLSIWNYKWAIFSGTMTTVSAFLPMLLVSGIMGEYMGILPKTVSATLLASLFVALVIIPTLCSRFYKKVTHTKEGKQHRHHKIMGALNTLKIYYIHLLQSILPSRRKRRFVVAGAIVLLIITILLPITGIMKVQMFPSIDFEYFVINAEMPVGTTLTQSSEIMAQAERIIAQDPGVDNYVTTIGKGFSFYAGEGSGGAEHVGSIIVNLKPEKERDRKSYIISEEMRPEIEAIQDGIFKVQELTAGPPSGAPFQAKIKGDDLQTLSEIAEQVKPIVQDITGLINIQDSIEESSGEFTFSVDRERVAMHGLDVTQVASTIRQAVFGVEASTVNLDGDDIDITVKYNKQTLVDAGDLENILLFTPTGDQIKIKQIARLSIEPSVLSINHLDGDKVIRVTAETTADADIAKINAEFNKKATQLDLPDGYKIETGGEFEDIERSFTEIFLSLIVAMFLIAFILVLQFDSFRQPFVIIFTVPLAIVGAFVGLTILRLDFSLPAFIGLVSLTGIVVNDAIVLIDRINKNLKRRMDFYEGVIEAGLARIQPIFLTSVTTIFGILPLALSEEMWMGLGFTIIFGLIFATILTLFFVPVVYTCLCRKQHEKLLNK